MQGFAPGSVVRATVRVVLRRLAREDVVSAIDRYRDQDLRLAAGFAAELEDVIARPSTNPAQFPLVHGDVRRALLKRFPYAAYFVARGGDLHVIAVLHQRRSPGVWKRRRS